MAVFKYFGGRFEVAVEIAVMLEAEAKALEDNAGTAVLLDCGNLGAVKDAATSGSRGFEEFECRERPRL